jgi:hypothetical protein
MKTYTQQLLLLANEGLLSTSGRPKVVVTCNDVKNAIATNLAEEVARNSQYTLQLISMILILFYTGVRLASIVAPMKMLKEDWRVLRWRVSLY